MTFWKKTKATTKAAGLAARKEIEHFNALSDEHLATAHKKEQEAKTLAAVLLRSRTENHYAERIRHAYEMEKRAW